METHLDEKADHRRRTFSPQAVSGLFFGNQEEGLALFFFQKFSSGIFFLLKTILNHTVFTPIQAYDSTIGEYGDSAMHSESSFVVWIPLRSNKPFIPTGEWFDTDLIWEGKTSTWPSLSHRKSLHRPNYAFKLPPRLPIEVGSVAHSRKGSINATLYPFQV